MEEELLKELDSILNPAVRNAWSNALRRNQFGGDPRAAFLDDFKIQMDHTKVDISKTMYKIDMAMQGCGTDVERAAAEVTDLFPPDVRELPDVDERDYVRPIENGFEVWDGNSWVVLSLNSNIKVEIFENPENENKPAVRVWANDHRTGTRVIYVDNDIDSIGWDMGRSWTDIDDHESFKSLNGFFYEDPFYNMAKSGVGLGGVVSGFLEVQKTGQHYMNWKQPLTGNNFEKALGKWKSADGIWHNFDEFDNINDFQKNSKAVSAHYASKRGAYAAKGFKLSGKIFFAASVVFSGAEAASVHYHNDANKWGVTGKSALDVTMGIVAFIPIYGWAISGVYFVADAFGAFDSWSQPSGMTQLQLDYLMEQRKIGLRPFSGNSAAKLDFELNYVSAPEQTQREMYFEERSIKVDNTKVFTPKILFDKH